MLHFVDTYAHKRIDLTSERYFYYENDIICISLKNNATEFMVTDYEKVNNGFDSENLNESYMSSISNVYQDKLGHVTI